MRTGTPSDFSNAELSPIMAVEINLDSANLRFWSGLGTVTIDGKTFDGAGDVIGVSAIEETNEIAAKGVSVTATGLDSTIIAVALTENYQNRPLTIYVGTIDESMVTDTYVLFRGRLDTMNIEENGDSANVTITAENRLIDLERPRNRRYTNEDQKSLYPGDISLEFVDSLQDKTIDWGKSS